MDKKVVLFHWTYDVPAWILGDHFTDKSTYGEIVWDTHIYTSTETNYQSVLNTTWLYLLITQAMEWLIGNPILAGEFGLEFSSKNSTQW